MRGVVRKETACVTARDMLEDVEDAETMVIWFGLDDIDCEKDRPAKRDAEISSQKCK